MTQKICKQEAIALSLILTIGCTLVGCVSPPPPSQTKHTTVPNSQLIPSLSDIYQTATQAVSLAKTPQTRKEWRKIVALWEKAAYALEKIPETNKNYATAQKKLKEYQNNLEIAQHKSDDPYPEAFSEAEETATLIQAAQTTKDWQDIVDGWVTAIRLMKQVPESSPNFQNSLEIKDYEHQKTQARTYVADYLIIESASYLDNNANWTDTNNGRRTYDALSTVDSQLVTDALVRQVRNPYNRLKVLFLSVKLGIDGSQEALVDALFNYSDKSIAEDYLNSGSTELYNGGKEWANARGYNILTGPGSHRASWGKF